MRRYGPLAGIWVLAMLAGSFPLSAAADGNVSGRPSLKGLSTFRVVVERLGPKAEKATGLRQQDLQADVEAQLAAAGIGVSKEAGALLYLNVALACNELVCAFNVALEVQQRVRLERSPDAGTLLTPTWSTGTTGLSGRRPDLLRARVRVELARFIQAHRSVNPKG
jgi:hypothetical protein